MRRNSAELITNEHTQRRGGESWQVPNIAGEAADDLADFKAQTEAEALEEQILKEIMEASKNDS